MRGKCPHCLHDVYFKPQSVGPVGTTTDWGVNALEGRSDSERIAVDFESCPNCQRLVVTCVVATPAGTDYKEKVTQNWFIWPRGGAVRPVPPEVPEHVRTVYRESAEVLAISPMASAALSRRCLQTVLTQAAHTKSKELSQQIDEVLPTLPSSLQEIVDAIRVVGNFATHPIKSKSSGEIVEVEAGEAESNLDVLDGLFDHYYVQPERLKQKKAAINQKLADAGKPPLK